MFLGLKQGLLAESNLQGYSVNDSAAFNTRNFLEYGENSKCDCCQWKHFSWDLGWYFSLSFLSLFFIIIIIFFLRAACVVCGSSQARNRIRATAAGLHYNHSNMGSEPVCDLYQSSQQCWILSPLRGARDWTHILMDTSHVHFRWATAGTLGLLLVKLKF